MQRAVGRVLSLKADMIVKIAAGTVGPDRSLLLHLFGAMRSRTKFMRVPTNDILYTYVYYRSRLHNNAASEGGD